MTTAWSHLPNAKHIDLVFESIKKYPDKWSDAKGEVWKESWKKIHSMCYNRCGEAWFQIREEIWNISRYSTDQWRTYINGRNAITSLFLYEDCAYLLYSDPEEVEVLANLGSIPAILLFPACIVFNNTKL